MSNISNTEDKRRDLIKMAKGIEQSYYIDYCVDVKGHLTILSGDTWVDGQPNELNLKPTEDDLHLYRDGDFAKREQAAASQLTPQQIIDAYLDFRAQHPEDGYGVMHVIAIKWCNHPEDNLRADRDDLADVQLEIRRRNRAYIKELYGDDLPLDYDFRADYDRHK